LSFQRILEMDARLSAHLRLTGRPGLFRSVAAFLAHSGDSWLWGGALGLLWWLGTPFWKNWAHIILLSIIGLAVLVLSIKFLVRRKRPEGDWGGMYRKTDPHSFPSGHAARAILIAVLVTALGPPWLSVVLWIWAPLVCLARVVMGVHYLSDILAGILTGLLAGVGILIFISG
jgi:undecaprenyl-diphosphatase